MSKAPQTKWGSARAIVGGMAIYWALVAGVGDPLVSRRYPPNVSGATMFLLVLGPFAIVTFIVVLVLTMRGKGL